MADGSARWRGRAENLQCTCRRRCFEDRVIKITRTSRMSELQAAAFSNFRSIRLTTSNTEINGVIGGEGPPLLLLHGWPQNLLEWHRVAPLLAKHFTVVATDL